MRRPYASRYFIHPCCYTEFSISKNGIASMAEGRKLINWEPMTCYFPGKKKSRKALDLKTKIPYTTCKFEIYGYPYLNANMMETYYPFRINFYQISRPKYLKKMYE